MIDRTGILHIPNSNYAYAPDEETFCVRLRAVRGNLKRCTLCYADRVCQTAPITFTALPMEEVAADRTFSFFEVTFHTPYSRLAYYFKLEAEDEWSYYYAGIFTRSGTDLTVDGQLLDGRSEYYQYPAILRTELAKVPAWLKNACVYNIFPDSFADSAGHLPEQGRDVTLSDGLHCRSHLGGTIRGIKENLDYIQGLGCNCVYLNPIFTAASYHKYDTIDYYHVDPAMGTDDDLRELVDAAHRREMRVILDGVFNHSGDGFFAFRDFEKRFQALHTRKVAFKDLRFFRYIFPCRIVRQDKCPHFASIVDQLTAHGSAEKSRRAGDQVKNILVNFSCHSFVPLS